MKNVFNDFVSEPRKLKICFFSNLGKKIGPKSQIPQSSIINHKNLNFCSLNLKYAMRHLDCWVERKPLGPTSLSWAFRLQLYRSAPYSTFDKQMHQV